METKLPHERLDVYRVYLETANQCGDVVANAEQQIVAFDHLERAIESAGINLIRANGQPAGSPARANYLDVSIASTRTTQAHEAVDESVRRERITSRDSLNRPPRSSHALVSRKGEKTGENVEIWITLYGKENGTRRSTVSFDSTSFTNRSAK
jgi:hypothetical protein